MGCPSAIAPPLGLTRSRSRPSSFSTARYCAANASFTSTTPIWSSRSSARASAWRPAGAGTLHRHDLLREPPGRPGPGRQDVAAGGERILFVAGDLVPRRQVLRGLRHPEPAGRVGQGLPQRILERRGAERQPRARAADGKRGLAHVLAPAGEDGIRLTGLDQARPLDGGFEPRPAEPVPREGGTLDPDARADPQ